MKIKFETGDGSLEVEPDSTGQEDHSAFLADLVSPAGLRYPEQRAPAEVTAAKDITPEIVERLVAHAAGLAIRRVA